jgi:hypothetical protein
MTTPALVVAGDKDVSSHLTVRGMDWHADPYFLSTGLKCLLTLFGAEHLLGGVSGYDAVETTDNLGVVGPKRAVLKPSEAAYRCKSHRRAAR